MELRFYIDPGTGSPHLYRHHVTEVEVEEVLTQPPEDRVGAEGARVAIGRAAAERKSERRRSRRPRLNARSFGSSRGVFMLRPTFVILIALLSAVPAVAQSQAVLEVFDDPGFTQRTGTMDGPAKVLYVRLLPAYGEYVGVEFSLTGLQDFAAVIPSFPVAPTLLLGSVVAPEDSLGEGGLNVAWLSCQTNEPFMTLTLVSADPPENRVIQVARRYPPSNPNEACPRQVLCDNCFFSSPRIVGESYVLNPTVSSEDQSWAAVKHLFR